jgi:hypothetical protein
MQVEGPTSTWAQRTPECLASSTQVLHCRHSQARPCCLCTWSRSPSVTDFEIFIQGIMMRIAFDSMVNCVCVYASGSSLPPRGNVQMPLSAGQRGESGSKVKSA